MKPVLSAMLVSQAFPPGGDVGGHRTVALCQHLVRQGWRVTVVAARPPAGARLDQGLLASVPKSVDVLWAAAPDLPLLAARIVKGRATEPQPEPPDKPAETAAEEDTNQAAERTGMKRVLDWLSWWLHVPDGATGWFLPAMWDGIVHGPRHRPDVVYSSAPAWTGHLIATALSHYTGAVLVSDFRDPWRGSTFRHIPYRAHRSVDAVLERVVVQRSRNVICAWDGIRKDLIKRYPHRAADIVTIHNGFDPGVIDTADPIAVDRCRCVFIHTGSFYGPRSPVPVLMALSALRQRAPHGFEWPLVAFLGLPTYDGRPIEDIAGEYGVQDSVTVIPPVPYRQAAGFLKGADVAMLFGQSGNHAMASVPAKVYEYIGAGKPVLAIGAGQEACELMRRGGCQVWSVWPDDPQGIAAAIAEIVNMHSRKVLSAGTDISARQGFSRSHMAMRIEGILRSAIDSRGRCQSNAG